MELSTIGDCLRGGWEALEPSPPEAILSENTPTASSNIADNVLKDVIVLCYSIISLNIFCGIVFASGKNESRLTLQSSQLSTPNNLNCISDATKLK